MLFGRGSSNFGSFSESLAEQVSYGGKHQSQSLCTHHVGHHVVGIAGGVVKPASGIEEQAGHFNQRSWNKK